MNRISTIQGHGQPGCRRADRGGAAADRMAALLKRVFIFIALMLTTASGAWAQTESLLTTITPDGSGNPVYSVANKATLALDGAGYNANFGWHSNGTNYPTMTACEGIVITKVKFTTNGGATWEDTAAPFQVKLMALYVYDSSNTSIKPGDGVSRIDVYGYEAPAYTVTLADGTEDAENWTITPAKAAEGETVTIQYNGTKRIKSITAVQTAAAEEQQEEAVTTATPLTMECLTDGTIVVDIDGSLSSGMQYAVNGGTKATITETTTIEGLKTGDKVQFYGVGTETQDYGYNVQVKIKGGTATVKVYGNIMSLLDEDNFATKTDLPSSNYVFYGLFHGNDKLTDASGLLLPATTLTQNCYYQMFYGCTALTAAPELPATTLANYCYNGMFRDCTALTAAPELPATTLPNGCYSDMFSGCTALTAAPALPATTLAESCYSYMFYGCKALTAAPELPATTLANYCYGYMFRNCSKLASVTCKATNISATYCLYNWLKDAGTYATSPTLYVDPTMTENAGWNNEGFTVTAITQ